jgi:hypothetical protein
VGGKEYSADYVKAILEKTGGMPLYIEMIVDFFNKRGSTEGGEDVADIVNAMSFQQVGNCLVPTTFEVVVPSA